MTNINETASKHLGRTSDGSLMQPYQSTDSIDASLLVAIPRTVARSELNLIYPMFGYDVWTCYEFSFIDKWSKLPVSYILRFSYKASSPNIVESKSVKLFLNTFNFVIMDLVDAISMVSDSLSAVVDASVDVWVYPADVEIGNFVHERSDCFPKLVCASLPPTLDTTENVDLLKFVNHRGRAQLTSHVLRSNCRVTNQPDWGDLYLTFEGVAPANIDAYIATLRNENHFHEEVIELIFARISQKTDNAPFMVAGAYTRRGGIDITPIRSSDRNISRSFLTQINNSTVLLKSPRQ